MTPHGLPFSDEMIRARVEDRKLVTRRVMRLPETMEINPGERWTQRSDGLFVARGCVYEEEQWQPQMLAIRSPYGYPGDDLNGLVYSREAWRPVEVWRDLPEEVRKEAIRLATEDDEAPF